MTLGTGPTPRREQVNAHCPWRAAIFSSRRSGAGRQRIALAPRRDCRRGPRRRRGPAHCRMPERCRPGRGPGRRPGRGCHDFTVRRGNAAFHHPGQRQQARQARPGHHGHRGRRQDQRRHRAHRRRAGDRRPERRPHPVAQQVGTDPVGALHGHREGSQRFRPGRHAEQLVPHAQAGRDVPDDDLRGLPPDVRRRHADHAHLQPADHRQGGRGAIAPADHVEASGRRVVLGWQPDPGFPSARLLAGAYHGELHRASGRRQGRPGPVRLPHADPVLHDRPLADRGRQHRHAPHEALPRRQAVPQVADQHRQAGRQHAERHLPDHREEQPGADEGAGLPDRGALVGPVHLVRRLLA